MIMTWKEMTEKLKDAGNDGTSQLHVRSEELQRGYRVDRLPRLKNALKKAARILVEAEIALPFNPVTGEVDDVYNSHNKYRPPFSATTTALALKESANSNDKLKQTLMDRAGVENWDTSKWREFTKEDWAIFGKYRVPRVFSLIVTHINIPAMNTGEWGSDFAVTVNRDSDGNVIGDVPSFLEANKFFRDKAYEEINVYNETVKSGECKDDDKAQKQHRADILGRIPVSGDRPANFVRVFELPLDAEYKLDSSVKLSGITKEAIKDFEVISNYKKGIRVAVESYTTGNWKKFDGFFDFFEMDQICPIEGDDSSPSGRAQIGLNTKFDRPTTPLNDAEAYQGGESTAKLVEALRAYIDGDMDVEVRVRRSMRVPLFDEVIEDKMYQTLSTVINLHGDEFITQGVVKNNQNFLRKVFPDEADEIIEEVDAGVSEKATGALDSEDASKMSAKYDLSDESFNDSLDLEDVDLGENVAS